MTNSAMPPAASAQAGHKPSSGRPRTAYEAAGVHIAAKTRTLGRIKDAVRSTFGPTVLSDIGGFGGLIAAPSGQRPVLVASVDSVGTKVRVATGMQRHDTIGHDLVNHCVNDILCGGARPLFFLDYFASSRLDPPVVEAVVKSLAAACRANGCALLGGETAELPGLYAEGVYDLAGCIVGVVEQDCIIAGESVAPGDVLLGLPSTGLHTNGYSLARHIFPPETWQQVDPALGRPIGEALLEPHRSYLDAITRLDAAITIKGLAHITGGGLRDNIGRVLPRGTVADVRLGTWDIPPLFALLQERGEVPLAEMCHVFNMGIGYVVICASDEVDTAQATLPEAAIIGEVRARDGPALVRVVDQHGTIVCTSESDDR